MGGYPPGTSRRDLKRAGIIQDPVYCVECDAEVTSEAHEDWCELQDLEVSELAELEAEDAQAQEYNPIEHKDL